MYRKSRPDKHRLSWAFPWISRRYCRGVIGLHEEIEDFYEYMKPTHEETKMRKHIIQCVNDIILALWPKAKLEVFGSFKTGLCLPTSDIDLVVFGDWKHLPLFTLEEALLKSGIANSDTVKVISRAVVPIVKFEHRDTQIKVDISFNKHETANGVKLIENYINEYPVLPKLMFVLKHFLLMRNLNEVFCGGLGSYALFLLCVSFLQLHPRMEGKNASVNLGVLLIEFFELYGRCFNYQSICIRVQEGGAYIKKGEFYGIKNFSSSLLCIEDPNKPENDVCKGSYAMPQVQEAFDFAYRLLTTNLCNEHHTKLSRPPFPSFLGLVVKITKGWVADRMKLNKHWRECSTSNSFHSYEKETAGIKRIRSHLINNSASTPANKKRRF